MGHWAFVFRLEQEAIMLTKMGLRHFEFHVSRQSRDRYQFDQSFFQLVGNVVFANFHSARVFAQRMNDKRDLVNYPEQAVKAGQINAMGLIDEVSHLMVENYRQQVNPNIMADALQVLDDDFGQEAVDGVIKRFSDEFPALTVYRREQALDEWLQGETDGVSNRELALEEMLMLWLSNSNPAFSPFMELFDDQRVEKQSIYPQIFPTLYAFFAAQPGFGADGQNLIDVLRAPALAAPHSLTAQLEFIRQNWGIALSKYLYRLLGSLDLIQEEEKIVFVGGGPGPSEVYEFGGLEGDPERYTWDRDWMPRLVLMAKNAYVWLDQLSRLYGREITRLDEVPDEELDRLARFGFTGLWLIGLWERSHASKRIKQLTGNPDAVASAYSLLDYRIASDLGGEEAVDTLRRRAWDRGIRLASDMVPNHMGIDSNWVMEHADWFVSAPYSPFPSYSFNGPNLSWNERVGIYLEDHYFDRTDAAVVFKRVDNQTGDTRYVYHGNDGTSMPWNDTAQLNYLMPEVREAVIQTILQVARQFPVIRFDAAMTLAKRHIQRLWFPEPGTGGAIASRADFGMTKQEFERLMPQEFWREVVDRAAVEAPDTLLLAEAFWMLEGYFVRTLGMHRVYNSAFMNMIRDEENAKYRTLIKNTLEFDPEILKRYVNFMNNPDERTAVDQFGKGDKYFGVCTLMVTLPGLPMIGHGQIEGYAEKYGMEYRRAYWDERPDPSLVDRHEREIVPLLRRRYLFAGVENYLLYDFVGADGVVNEDVFAYSNRVGDERSLVVIHNKYATARGWVRMSVPFSVKSGEERATLQRSLGEGLAMSVGDRVYTIFRDHTTNLEYIRPNAEIHDRGLYLELGAYKTQVFLDFREVHDNEWRHYGNLVDYLKGQGVPSIDEALRETFLQPIHAPYRELVNADLFRRIMAQRTKDEGRATKDEGQTRPNSSSVPHPSSPERDALLDEVEQKALHLGQEIKAYTGGTGDETALAREIRTKLQTILELGTRPASSVKNGRRKSEVGGETKSLASFDGLANSSSSSETLSAMNYIRSSLGEVEWTWGALLAWLFTHPLGKLVTDTDFAGQSRSWVDEWLLRKIITGTLQNMGADEAAASRGLLLVNALINQQRCLVEHAGEPKPAYQVVEAWLKDDDVRAFLQVNRHQSALWYNKETFDQMLGLALLSAVLDTTTLASGSAPERSLAQVGEEIGNYYAVVRALQRAQATSEYRVEKLLAAARGETPTRTASSGSA
jgi:glycosidase